MTEWNLPDRFATGRFGGALGRLLPAGSAVALIGDLGAGKTALAQAIARGLNIDAHVASPTFGLIHEYPGAIPLFHFDPYRLNSITDLEQLGFHEYFERNGVVLVEWADMFPELLPAVRLNLHIEFNTAAMEDIQQEDGPRILRAEAHGERYARLIECLASDPALRDLLRPPGGESAL